MAFSNGVVRGSVAVFYLLIGLEILIMVSPFAAYFYAVYGPLLNWLYSFPATAWLTGFFLPHAVVSKSALLNFINSFGHTLFSLGLIAFLFGAVQIYSAKFRRKGVVTGWLYRWIRHPQYLFLAVAGLGLLLFWPRFFILALYISMLFVYYLLARHEEQRMLAQHDESYHAYMQRTAMFIPGKPGGKIFRAMFGMRPRAGGSLRGALGFIFPFLSRHSHHEMMGAMADGPVRLIFSQLTWPDGEHAPFDKALAFTVKHLPLLKVDIDTTDQTAMTVERTSPRNYWGQMPMPAF